VLLVVDAAYAEYAEAPDYASGRDLALRTPNTVMLRTFSKLFGLAALRLGWLVAAAPIVDVVNRVRGPFNVALPAQAAGVAALLDAEHQDRALAHNRTWLPWLAQQLSGLGLRVHPSLGNFLLIDFPAEPGRDAAAANAHLEAEGVILRQMAAYGLPRSLRASVGLEAENRRLIAALAGFQRGRAAA
jgi:histidinol-phosphate aminotransferase